MCYTDLEKKHIFIISPDLPYISFTSKQLLNILYVAMNWLKN
jgi:hypothetical protein